MQRLWHCEYDLMLYFDFRLKIKDEQGARIQKATIGRTLRSLNKIEEAYKVQRDTHRSQHASKLDNEPANVILAVS